MGLAKATSHLYVQVSLLSMPMCLSTGAWYQGKQMWLQEYSVVMDTDCQKSFTEWDYSVNVGTSIACLYFIVIILPMPKNGSTYATVIDITDKVIKLDYLYVHLFSSFFHENHWYCTYRWFLDDLHVMCIMLVVICSPYILVVWG